MHISSFLLHPEGSMCQRFWIKACERGWRHSLRFQWIYMDLQCPVQTKPMHFRPFAVPRLQMQLQRPVIKMVEAWKTMKSKREKPMNNQRHGRYGKDVHTALENIWQVGHKNHKKVNTYTTAPVEWFVVVVGQSKKITAGLSSTSLVVFGVIKASWPNPSRLIAPVKTCWCWTRCVDCGERLLL